MNAKLTVCAGTQTAQLPITAVLGVTVEGMRVVTGMVVAVAEVVAVTEVAAVAVVVLAYLEVRLDLRHDLSRTAARGGGEVREEHATKDRVPEHLINQDLGTQEGEIGW
mmetsp:Transcript_34495/g.91586  ORF Transcript_34495/g.91586 Transcript_34495/m.91586 type:complete len:109 (+) Transcript_34495:479-805(+)